VQLIKCFIKNQRLWRYTSGTVVEGSYGYLKFEFIFKTEDWNAATTKTAVFSYKGKNYEAELDEYNQCYVPKEAIHDPCFKVSLYGGNVHTNTITIPVEPKEGIGNDTSSSVVFVPEISDKKILSWSIKEVGNDLTVPAPTDLNPFDEWVDDETVSDYVWEEE
jgi:hypothetical protein